MRRFLLWSLGLFLSLVVAVCGFLWWALSGWDIPEEPFQNIKSLPNGTKVVVSGAGSVGFHGDYAANYTISLQWRGQKSETVTHGHATLTGSDDKPVPFGPFNLQSEGKYLFFTDGQLVFVRPRNGGNWFRHALLDDPNLAFWGRAIWPDRYAHSEKFGDKPQRDIDAGSNRLPPMPQYLFERWNLKKRLVVLRTTATMPSDENWNDQTRLFWPQRLVFENWRFSLTKTLQLEPKWKLRAFPHDVQVKIAALDFADDNDAPLSPGTFQDAAKIRSAKGLWRQNRALSSSVQSVSLEKWWSQKGATRLQIRGVCADLNPQLLHFQWRVGEDGWIWAIAHRGQQVSLREPEGSVLEAPYLYARFTWPVRQTNVHDLLRTSQQIPPRSKR